MLRALSVRNLVLVDHASLHFAPGMVAITGETGAGKSLVMGSLRLACGERANTRLIGPFDDQTVVQAEFELGEAQYDVRRSLRQSGNHVVRLDGENATLAQLNQTLNPAVRIYDQDQARVLGDASQQRRMLDRFVPEDVLDLVENQWDLLAAAKRALTEHNNKAQSRADRIQFLKFQIQKLESFVCAEGTFDALKEQALRARHAHKIQHNVSIALEALREGEASADSQISTALQSMQELADVIDAFGEQASILGDCLDQIDEAVRFLQSQQRDDETPENIDELEGQIAEIEAYTRDHGIAPDDQQAHLATLTRELASLDHYDDTTAELTQAVAEAQSSYEQAALKLHNARTQAGRSIIDRALPLLAELALPDAELEFSLSQAAPGPHGSDEVALLFSANSGINMGPIDQVASGGELSRTLLALLVAEAQELAPMTLVFDEIDAGVGGQTAFAIANTLRKLAQKHQVIVITHLPQVAAAADQQYGISKVKNNGRATARVVQLEGSERERDLSRMLGASDSKEALTLAQTMLQQFHA